MLISLYEYVCTSYAALGDETNTKKWCDETLAMDADNVEALLVLAESMIEKEEYEEAVRMYKKAHENGGDQRAQEGYQRATRLVQQAGEKNYYKVLGIARNSSKRQIKKVRLTVTLMNRRLGN